MKFHSTAHTSSEMHCHKATRGSFSATRAVDAHSQNSCGSIRAATGRVCWLHALSRYQQVTANPELRAARSSVLQLGLFPACPQPGCCASLCHGWSSASEQPSAAPRRAAPSTSCLNEQKPTNASSSAAHKEWGELQPNY